MIVRSLVERDSSQCSSDATLPRLAMADVRRCTAPTAERSLMTMPIVADSHPYIVGVDTHARNHVYSILATHTGAPLDTRSFPNSAAEIARAISWVSRHTAAGADTLWVIEGADSHGATLAGIVAARGYPVAEPPRVAARNRRGVGRPDAMHAFRIAAAARLLLVEELRRSRW